MGGYLLIYFIMGIYDSMRTKGLPCYLGLLTYFSMGIYESKQPNGLSIILGLLIYFSMGIYDSRELSGLLVIGLSYFLGRLAVYIFLLLYFFSNIFLSSMLKLDMF